MNENILIKLEKDLQISKKQIITVLNLLKEGNTIPFIARYRKEMTNALDEESIRKISLEYQYQENLFKRKEDVIRLIDEKGLLTEDLKNEILIANKLVEVEDLYRPYKEKKKTKAGIAINNGLEPLSKLMLSFKEFSLEQEAEKYLNDNVLTITDAINGACDIIAGLISDNSDYRKWIRKYLFNNALITSKLKKKAIDEKKIYEIYYDYHEKVKYIPPHRILAVNRGENENVLTVSLDYDKDDIIKYLESKVIKKTNISYIDSLKKSIIESLDRLILPSVTREIRNEITEKANIQAIHNFSQNLEALLLTPPLKEKTILALDPAYRTGSKLAVLDKTGKVLDITVIYPVMPHNKVLESEKIVLDLINKYQVDVIAIGNGTASRENESFIASTIKKSLRKVEYIIVNEAGASVYSASKLGIEEFPDLTVEKRSAISIGRRLQDSLAELVKIDPKSIGVGLYQHDVSQKELSESLDFTVFKIVNQIGVNINTASFSLLKYISGLNKKVIDNIISYRNQFGKINSRLELKKIKGMSDKIYEQSVGFLRIIDGNNPLDETDIHPDNYQDVINLLDFLGLTLNDLGTDKLISKIKKIDLDEYSKKLKISKYTLEDIIKSLEKPNRDLRDVLEKPLLKSDILTINDLKINDKVQGTVRNVVDFGAFIDIGLHNDGLVHISKISKNYIKHPSEVLTVGDIIDCYILNIDLEKEKVSLSLIEE